MAMIEVDDKLVSTELFSNKFVCNLSACKGACCVEGDDGAPVTKEEQEIMKNIFPTIKPYLRDEGIRAIEERGVAYKDNDEDWVTTLVNGQECAFATFDDNGVASCGIEKAYNDGATSFKKPISCELYPVRINEYPSYEVVNYDEWSICSPACAHGEALGIKVYVFLKDALIRKYGAVFYKKLKQVDKHIDETG